jgi:hypothetical protein
LCLNQLQIKAPEIEYKMMQEWYRSLLPSWMRKLTVMSWA